MIITKVRRPLLPGDSFAASIWASGFQNVPRGHFRAVDFQQSRGDISGDLLLGTYGHFGVHMLRLALSEAVSTGNGSVSGSVLTPLNSFV